ncbi:MAG: hypothetical protein ABIL91_00580 [candidate division WOR-3 bacterium]
MKITRIEINKFGPLRFKEALKPGLFNLFWGSNEAGKTLTIEAILSSLPFNFKGDRTSWDRLYNFRVNSNIDVVLEIEDEGKIYSLRSGTKLESPLTRSEMFRLYFILNSELPYELEEKKNEVFQKAMDRLSSTYVNEISAVLKSLLEVNNLTPNLDFRDTEAAGKLKSRLDSAEIFLNRISDLLKRIEEENLNEIEYEIALKKRMLGEIAETESKVKQLRKAQIYYKSTDLLDRYENQNARLQSLKIYTDESLFNLQKRYEELQRTEEELESLKERELKPLEEKIKELDKQLSEALKIKNEKQRIELTEKVLIDKIIKYKDGLPKYEFNLKLRKKMNILSILFGVLFVTSIAVPILTKIPLLFILPVLLFVLTFYSVMRYSMALSEIRDFLSNQKELFDRARSLGLKAAHLEDIENELQNLKNEVEKKEKAFERLQGEKSSMETLKTSLIDKIKILEQKKVELTTLIDSEIEKLRVKDLKELEERVTQRRNVEDDLRSIISELKGLWGHEIQYEDDTDLIIKIGRELVKIRPDEVESRDSESSTTTGVDLNELDERKKRLQEEIDLLSGKIEDIKREFILLENEYINITREPFSIETISDLLEAKSKVEDWKDELLKTRELVMYLIKLIDEEYKDMKSRFTDLFTNLSDTSWIFSEITGKKYNRILFDQEKNVLKVEDNQGNVLDIESLSGGALDQLFFSIRLGLGRKMLGNRTGFFVFDDPFIKSDGSRLHREIDLLMKVAEEGWQILFFTCKDEVKEYLFEHYKDKVNFIDLEKIAIIS